MLISDYFWLFTLPQSYLFDGLRGLASEGWSTGFGEDLPVCSLKQQFPLHNWRPIFPGFIYAYFCLFMLMCVYLYLFMIVYDCLCLLRLIYAYWCLFMLKLRSGERPGGRNPLHYNGVSSPLGVKSDVLIDIGLQSSSYCRGNIHIWKTARAAARDLEGVGAPSSILLEQIGGVGGDLKRLDKTRHFRNTRPHFLDTVVHSGRKWRFGTRVSQKATHHRGRKAGATGLGK